MLAMLEADCGGKDSPNECACCTSCCDRENKICEVVEERRLIRGRGKLDRRLIRGKIQDLGPKQDLLDFHEHIIPRERTLQSESSDCTARYRWDSDTGALVNLEEETEEEEA